MLYHINLNMYKNLYSYTYTYYNLKYKKFLHLLCLTSRKENQFMSCIKNYSIFLLVINIFLIETKLD